MAANHHRGRRPGVWAPGDMLVIDWGEIGPLFVFCAVLAWSRWRFVFFADNLRAETTFAALAACFEELGGVPKTVLSDRMGCLKGGTVAGVVVPTADYVRFATHYGFRPDFCEGHDPESKGLVENLVGYVKSDLMIPAELTVADLAGANAAGVVWCAEVNAAVHSEIGAVPAERLVTERELLRRVAVAAGPDRQARHPQGRPAELRPVRLGPLLGPDPPHRPPGRGPRRRRRRRGDPVGRGRGRPSPLSRLGKRRSTTTTTAGRGPPRPGGAAQDDRRDRVLRARARWPRRSSRPPPRPG